MDLAVGAGILVLLGGLVFIIAAAASRSRHRCAVCSKGFARTEVTSCCVVCGAHHHPACWHESGRCAKSGCASHECRPATFR